MANLSASQPGLIRCLHFDNTNFTVFPAAKPILASGSRRRRPEEGKIVISHSSVQHFAANIDIIDKPLTPREDAASAWFDTEIDDVMAFRQT